MAQFIRSPIRFEDLVSNDFGGAPVHLDAEGVAFADAGVVDLFNRRAGPSKHGGLKYDNGSKKVGWSGPQKIANAIGQVADRLSFTDNHGPIQICDIGTANGFSTLPLRQFFKGRGQDVSVLGFDVAPLMLADGVRESRLDAAVATTVRGLRLIDPGSIDMVQVCGSAEYFADGDMDILFAETRRIGVRVLAMTYERTDSEARPPLNDKNGPLNRQYDPEALAVSFQRAGYTIAAHDCVNPAWTYDGKPVSNGVIVGYAPAQG